MKYISILLIASSLASCNWAKKKTKETINKAGQVAAQTGSEFASGVYKGVEKTFQNQVTLSPQLKREGLRAGKNIINSSDSTIDNILTAYLIFDQGFDQKITVKIFNEKGQEYGRVMQKLANRIEKMKDQVKTEEATKNAFIMPFIQTYCAVLMDDNNRKPLARLYFNGSKKYLGLFDKEKNEKKHQLTALNDVYMYSDDIKRSA